MTQLNVRYPRILCAAIYVDDGTEYPHCPPNKKTGFMICGHRHHNCFEVFGRIAHGFFRSPEQGFVDAEGNFLNRKEALFAAKWNNQVVGKHLPIDQLCSEDLY